MTPQSLRTPELRVAGICTVLREAGPAHDREAAVFIHGNPGSSADWASLLGPSRELAPTYLGDMSALLPTGSACSTSTESAIYNCSN